MPAVLPELQECKLHEGQGPSFSQPIDSSIARERPRASEDPNPSALLFLRLSSYP